ncbi:hypothetical protein Tco_1139940 [Tanacetum coccineum]
MKLKEPTYQVVLDALTLATCYPAFLITAFFSREEDDTKDDKGNDDGDDSDENDDDDNDNDGDDDDDDNVGNDDDDSDQERTKSDRDEIPNLSQFNKEHEEEEEENINEFTDKEDEEENEEESDDDQHNVSQDSGFEQEEEDSHVTLTTIHDTQKTEGLMQSSSVSSNFIEKLLNFDNVSPADNEIASLMDTIVHTKEPSGQTSTLITIPIIVIPTTIPLPPHFLNPISQQTTPTPTPTASEITTAFPALPDFASVFRFNDRLGEAIHKASQSHNAEFREEAQAEKQEYIDLVDSSVRTIIIEEFKTQLPQILPKAVLDFATPSTYKAVASLLEYELMKILLDKMEESKSHLRADYRMKIYDALVESYNTDKDLFNTYGEVFTLKRSRDDKDKDQDISAGSDRGMKRRKSSKEAESPKDQRLKEGKSSSSSKGTSHSHHKSSGKSDHAEEPSHIVDDSGVQKNQEFDTCNNNEQPDNEAASKNDWFKKPERPPTPDPDWNKRQQMDFQPAQTWISVTAHAEKPPTLFNELMDTPIDFSAFVMNQLNISNRTQELLVGLAFNLLKGTCKSYGIRVSF